MELSEERRALRDAVRGLLAEHSTRAALDRPAGYDSGLWSRLCKQIGVAGLAVPEAYGGAGATLLESHVVLAEWGRVLTPGPMLGCGVLATQALLRSGDPDACRRLLPGVCAGDRIVAPAWPGEPDRVAVAATAGGRLTGEAGHVLDAETADVLLVAARDPAPRDPIPRDPTPHDPIPRDPTPRDPIPRDPTPRDPTPHDTAPDDPTPYDLAPQDLAPRGTAVSPTATAENGAYRTGADGWAGIALYEVAATAPGVTRRPADGLDLTRRLTTVRFDGAPGRRLGGGDLLSGLRDLACVALSAEQVGAAAGALETTLAYVRRREQFGRPIGSFQVLQHRLAEAYVRLEAATTASWTAAEAVAAGRPDAPDLAAVAKVYCSETLLAIAGEMVQMHGGIAITWEHDAHLYLRRAYADAHLFGAPARHVARLAASLLPDRPASDPT